jgi:hypothetical protein
MNERLIFQHLPKCGGTTIHSILERMYEAEHIFDIKVIDHTRLNTEEFIQMDLKRRKKILLIKGHLLYGLHEHMHRDCSYFTFLRRPEERIISFYEYVQRRPEHRLYEQVIGKGMNLYNFATTISEGDVHNGQIRFISGIEDKPEFMLEKALENIEKHFSLVGTLDKFEESLVLLKHKYQWTMPYFHVLNKTKDRTPLSALDSKTLEVIRERNQGDIELYSIMSSKLDQAIKKEPNMMIDLLKLKAYNKIMSDQRLRNIASKVKRFTGMNLD